MKRFNVHEFRIIPENKVLKIKLKEITNFISVVKVSKRVLQAYQPASTPITKITLKVVQNIEAYKSDKEDYDDFYEIEVEPEEIEAYELVEL
jgi:hypothetical protein